MTRKTIKVDSDAMTANEALQIVLLFSNGRAWLADRLGLSKQCLWEWEKGLRPIPARWHNRIKLAAVESVSWLG